MAIVTGSLTMVDLNDSKQLQLYISSGQPKSQIFDPNTGSYTPDYTTVKPVLTPELYVAGTSTNIISQAKTITWDVDGLDPSTDSADYTLGTGNKTLTINTNVLTSVNSRVFTCTVIYTDPVTNFDTTVKADIEFVKVTNGQKGATGSTGASAVTAVLNNDAQTIPTDSSGNNGNFTGANSTMSIYVGATDDSANWTVTASATSGITGSLSGKTYTVTAMTIDTGTVTFTASKSGYANVTKVFTLTKAKQGTQGATGSTGASGTSPTAYWMTTVASAIQKSISGTLSPSSFTVSGFSQTGSGAVTAYSGYWNVYSTTSAVTSSTSWGTATRVPASGTATTGTLTIPSNSLGIKVDFLTSGGTVVDSQIIPVVTDGATGATGATGSAGADAITAYVWTPNGNTIKNSANSLTAQIDVYKGGAKVTATAYKWYVQDPTATTSSGGDSDGGNGWRLLTSTYTDGTSGYTTAVLTIPASAVGGVESFKAVATYNSLKYSDVCTVIDISDPIQVVLSGSNIFKNGQGSNTLTAKLYQAGAEIDSAGTQYTYTWSIYDSTDTKTSFTATGKIVTINASDINGQGNVTCDIS